MMMAWSACYNVMLLECVAGIDSGHQLCLSARKKNETLSIVWFLETGNVRYFRRSSILFPRPNSSERLGLPPPSIRWV